jgi:aminoglycoside 3-N-acetyltransferase
MGVGPPLANLTPLHAVEAMLRYEDPFFASLFHDTTTYRWSSPDGAITGEHTFLHRHGAFNAARFGKHYPRAMFRTVRLSNLRLWSISARDAITTGVELGRRGITMYRR